MGPSRKATTSDPSSSKQPSNTPHKKSKRPQHKKHPAPPPSASNALPGVQKIKAALRQTRRLLAKDNLAADVRVATERRLKSLEADLAKAEQARLERTMATRYHKIKFFERQKVSRKLNQTKRKLASEDVGAKERKELEARLAELRVDLNYILHYPKTKKYISLFPPEVRQAKAGQSAAEAAREAKEKSDTDKQREEIRAWMRKQMDAGELSWEPEVELEKAERKAAPASKATSSMETQSARPTKEEKKSKAKPKAAGIADDDFLGGDDDEDEDGEQDKDESSSDSSDDGGGGSDEDVDMDED